MNNRLYAVFVVISALMGVVIYIASENIFLSIGVLTTFIITSFALFIPNLKRFNKVSNRFHECYHFINNFIISLSIKKAISSALENTVLSMNESFVEMMNSLENMSDDEKLRYLNGGYFPFHVYRLFIQVIELYEEQGGDILESSKYLLDQCRYYEEYVTACSSLAIRKYFGFGVLWAISLSILVMLRFTLTDFYGYIKTQTLFIVSLGVLSLFIAFSIYVLILRATKIEIKGYDKHEKII